MNLMYRKFLEAVKEGRVTRGKTGQVSEVRPKQFQRKANTDFKLADAAGHLLPYETGDGIVIRLSALGEQALADALAARGGAANADR